MSLDTITTKCKNIEMLLDALKQRGATQAEIEMFEMLRTKYKLDEAFLRGIKEES